jgi:pyruvate formate lyase activating enzyme
VEVTTLVVPGVNDSDEEMDALSAWLASVDPDMTLHVTRFHPAWRMRDRGPTPVKTMHRLAKVARGNLDHVCLGNMPR